MRTVNAAPKSINVQEVSIPIEGEYLQGELGIPAKAPGVVLFAHGSGSSRHSPRNQYVARIIREAGVGTLLFDLLTASEEMEDEITRAHRFNIELLADRLVAATKWLLGQPNHARMNIGYFGSSTGGGAALGAAAFLGPKIGAVVSRGGRPDLAGAALPRVKSPTLLIVGGHDHVVLDLNNDALGRLKCEKELRVIPGATHLFDEPGTLEQVAEIAAEWFASHLGKKMEIQT